MSAGAAPWTPGMTLGAHEFRADEIDLFRFSAVTWNAHRIHYDLGQAERDGLRGLAVQAHLQGAWLAQVARSVAGPAARLRELAWQNRAPVIAGERVVVTGQVESVENADGRQRVGMSLTEAGEDGDLRAAGRAVVEVGP